MDNKKMIQEWLECYQRAKEFKEPLDVTILNECSAVHYRHLNMDLILKDYEGNLDGFIKFICQSWGWSVEKTQTDGVIQLLIDEQKDYCVCPLVSESVFTSPDLCECSKAFNKRMFQKIIGTNIDVSLGRTYLRDKKSCQYIIQWTQ